MAMQFKIGIKNIFTRIFIVCILLCLASAIGLAFRALKLPETNIAIVYLLAVLLSTLLVPGYVFGFITSIVAAFAFNFFLTEPYFTFTAHAPSYIITFIIMTITAFISSSLASHAKISAQQAKTREAETKALYTLTKRLTDAADIQAIAAIATHTISQVIGEKAGCLCFDEKGLPEATFIQQLSEDKQIQCEVADRDAILSRIKELQTSVAIGAAFYDWPIHGREAILGLIRIPSEQAQLLTKAQTRLLRSMIESVALAMDRFRSVQERIRSQEEAEQERYRSNLLRSISHDLRTPLAGILGTTEMLASMTEKQDRRYGMIEGISKDARWLHALVENILSLTRLQEGKLALKKQQEVVEEVLGGAVAYMSHQYPEYEIEAQAPDELLLAPMDAKLIHQVLINLLENAVKHTRPPGKIQITVHRDREQNQAVFSVQDTGSGIAAADLPHLFQMFYTSQAGSGDARQGIGLGLAICQSIVKAHGGSISARNRTDSTGAEFTFTLPLAEK